MTNGTAHCASHIDVTNMPCRNWDTSVASWEVVTAPLSAVSGQSEAHPAELIRMAYTDPPPIQVKE